MSSIAFPLHSSELTPELLTRALATQHPDAVVQDLRVVEEAHCETGSASTAARAVLDLAYAGDPGLPSHMVLKTVLIRPGAPRSMYRNEVRFYREIRPQLDLETPTTYASVFDEQTGTFGVLMEDLRERGARFPNATQSMTEDEIHSLLGQLARLHARFWESPRFARDLDWLWTPLSGGFAEMLLSSGPSIIQHLVGQSELKQSLLVQLGQSFDALWGHLWRAQAILDSEPITLLHGDTHFGNTYLLPGGRVGLIDWQLMNRGRWAHDVTYILVTALDIELRRRCERDLLAFYLDEVRALGVTSAPTVDEAWLLYRQTAIWGFLIGWMLCPVENYGPAITEANLERLATALEDLETFDALAG